MFSLKDIIEQITDHSGKGEDEVKKLIKEKQEELSGLVSEEGAAYIVARELGLNLLQEGTRQLKINNLVEGLRSVDLVGKVVRISEPRNWEKNGKKGTVCNVLIADETGAVRLSLWNDEVGLVKEGKIKEDYVVRILGGYVKADNRGAPELRIGKGRIEKIEEELNLPERPAALSAEKEKNISEFSEGDYVSCRGCMVQVYRRNPFYEVCPECGSRISESDGKWMCKEHEEVKPKYRLVVSGVIDDGFGNIRTVFFGELAEKVFGKNTEELRKEADSKKDIMSVYDGFTLGKEMMIKGAVRRNSFTEDIEFIARDIKDIDPAVECNQILVSMEGEKSNS